MSNSILASTDREIVVSRVINTLPELVWEAWTDPKHIMHWWGPNGFSTTTKEFNFKAGGTWRFTMHGPDGTDFPNHIIFEEIERPARLVYRHSGVAGTVDVRFTVTVTFEETNGKTKVTMHSLFESAEVLREVVEKYGAIEGGKQHLARLDEYVTKSLAN